tara:strand:- start:2017 stop:2829 length:813 start_codon:yes stop_codon:yes gene_type:complete
MEKEIAVVYMVAGLSSRFGGKIKQFAKVGPEGETLIEYSLKQALRGGVNRVVFVVGEKTESGFREMFGDSYKGTRVTYAFQEFDSEKRDKPWGTLDALCCAKNVIDCPFIVCNGDDIYGENTFRKLVDHLKKNEGNATVGFGLGYVLPDEGTGNRGIFDVEEGMVRGIREEFDVSRVNLREKNLSLDDLCSMNIFAFQLETLDLLQGKLDAFKKKYAGDREVEALLPEKLGNLISEGKIEMSIYPAVDKWLGITRPEDEDKVRESLKRMS